MAAPTTEEALLSSAIALCNVQPEPVRQLAVLLADVEAFLGRFISFPTEHAKVATTLWIAHTHVFRMFETTPRIAFISPEPASGKTRALEVLELLVAEPMATCNVTAPVLFRAMARPIPPTVLLDEADVIFGPHSTRDDLRGLINAGHRAGATVQRCAGNAIIEFTAFAPIAVAGLHELPRTIMSRSILIRMRPRTPQEHVEPFRQRLHRPQAKALRDDLAVWADSMISHDGVTFPDLPLGIEDRDADVWEPLLMLADLAGPSWNQRCRDAAVAMVTERRTTATPSLGVALLHDIRRVFEHTDSDRVSSENLLHQLHNLTDTQWANLRGRPLNAVELASILKNYGISPTQFRVGSAKTRGYRRSDFIDAWNRYTTTPA